ncbi:MAG: protein kinase [Myxococcota bacterium]
MVSDAATTEDALLWDGRYRLVRTLGEGGMGRVILGHDRLQGDRPVALKRLQPAVEAETPSFVREFLLHRQLAHPNIPRAYELGHARDGGVLCPYFTMEVAPGMPLHELVERSERGLPLRAIVQVVTGLLRALDHVHRHGYVHGDLKPGNLLVSERFEGLHLHLVDFGVGGPSGKERGEAVVTTPE